MNGAQFKKGLSKALVGLGFEASGKSLRRSGTEVSILISFEKGFGSQWFITVGFWLHALGELATDRVEQTHLYFRLERLLPESREVILTAGCLDDPAQQTAYDSLIEILKTDADFSIRTLGTEAGLRRAMRASRLSFGLIRKEARQYLEA